MIRYLLWLFYQGKGSISKYGIRSQLKSCKMNTMQWSWRVHKEHVLLYGVMSFVLGFFFFFFWELRDLRGWRRSEGLSPPPPPLSLRLRPCQQHEDVVPGGGTGTWVVHQILSPGHVIKNQWTLMKSKITVTISMKINANQAPTISFFMNLLWLMWWTFCEIKWFDSSF